MFFNWGLQGILTVQVYFYYLLFPKDPVALRYLVYGILAYEWVQTGLITEVAFDNFVYGYGDRNVLTAFHNTWFSVTIMCSIVSGVVQSYFAYRTWVLARSVILTSVIAFISIGQMCIGIAGGVMLHVIDPSAAAASLVTPVISAWLACAAFADIVIAIAMTCLLWQAKSGIKHSDNMINKLIRLVVETGTVTATVAIADLICFTAFSNTLLHECPALMLAKLYTNTFLASLNNRYILRQYVNGATVAVDTTVSSNSLPMRGLGSRLSGFRPAEQRSAFSQQGHISIREETFVVHDLDVYSETDAKDRGLSFSNKRQSEQTVKAMDGAYAV
ncbi:hypothetical protein BD309DRAFT_857070 [Dichomitus squalens]|nr:uncharacterized protein DICSQDRAFT_148672 [Dichomitus squalens LYAD-421 SS1]EJF59193.1 hypothetical protein DICSQDRAFT_148672 [Dichomitus squalens LYAD-421 SS1]TBU46917.1 hypothetical protein BD309DRAFT_857070 [Dichomitus squalens]